MTLLFQHLCNILVRTIRRKSFFSSGNAIILFILLQTACGTRREKDTRSEVVQPALIKVYDLYELIGQLELDTLTSTYDKLEHIIMSNDTLNFLTLTRKDIILQKRNSLAKYIGAFNEFHEEIFAVEDHILQLENSYRTGKMDERTIKETIERELLLLNNIEFRIKTLRNEADSVLGIIYQMRLDH